MLRPERAEGTNPIISLYKCQPGFVDNTDGGFLLIFHTIFFCCPTAFNRTLTELLICSLSIKSERFAFRNWAFSPLLIDQVHFFFRSFTAQVRSRNQRHQSRYCGRDPRERHQCKFTSASKYSSTCEWTSQVDFDSSNVPAASLAADTPH